MLSILEKKVQKIPNATGIFQEVLIRFWFVQLVLFCFLSLLACLIVFTVCSLFRLSWISMQTYSAWLSWCPSTEGDVKQTLLPLKQLSASSVEMQLCHIGLMLRSLFFFSREQKCWIMLIMPTHPVVCLQTPLCRWLNAF